MEISCFFMVCRMSSLETPPSLPQSFAQLATTTSNVVTTPDTGFNLEDHAWILQDPSVGCMSNISQHLIQEK
jgi:hypothetical protein